MDCLVGKCSRRGIFMIPFIAGTVDKSSSWIIVVAET
jgi:hypothetical protein